MAWVHKVCKMFADINMINVNHREIDGKRDALYCCSAVYAVQNWMARFACTLQIESLLTG